MTDASAKSERITAAVTVACRKAECDERMRAGDNMDAGSKGDPRTGLKQGQPSRKAAVGREIRVTRESWACHGGVLGWEAEGYLEGVLG